MGVFPDETPCQVNTRDGLTAPADFQIGLPSSSVPDCRAVIIHQRITCGTLSFTKKEFGTIIEEMASNEI